MTNTTHFYGIIQYDTSSTSSSDKSLQLQLTPVTQPPAADTSPKQLSPEGKSSSPVFTAIGKAIHALLPRRTGSPPNDSSNDEKDSKSSGIVPLVSLPKSPPSRYEILESGNLKIFSFKELKTATRNFHPDLVLGQGGSGLVFKARIDPNTLTATKQGNGITVAIRCLNSPIVQGHKEWLAEIYYLEQLNHPNLVRLYGYSFENEKRLLVYEFMPGRSLDNHLFKWGFSHLISWRHRMRIALGAAKGLSFLHRADINVTHRRFRSSNILLDSKRNAKLSDIGLARGGPTNGMSLVSTIVMGTDGYAAPEYLATGHMTTKCDIYSFGVVLLELLSGRRTIDHNRPPAEWDLVQWAKPYLISKHKVFHVLDSNLERECPLQSAKKIANLTLKCLAMEPKMRPNIEEVVLTLEQLQVS